jgi:putative peptide zinc metalloprotease protein
MTTAFDLDSRPAVGYLVVRREDEDDYVVGDPRTGIFVAVPAVGARLIAKLAAGRSIAEAAEEVERETGEYLDALDFVAALADAGVLDQRTEPDAPQPKVRYWSLSKIPARYVRPLFGRAAWTVYALCLTASIAILVAEPSLVPTYEDTFFLSDILASIIITNVVVIAFTYLHEIWHAFAGAAAGIPSRLRIDLRGIFPVLETDVTGLWTLPPERRYSPYLAGMAIDGVLLFASLSTRFAWSRGWIEVPPGLIRFLALLVFTQLARMVFQSLAYLRTDMYLVLSTATGCQNLHQVTRLSVKRLILKLKPDEAAALRDAHPRDLRVARWYRLLYLAGMLWMVWFAWHFLLPSARLVFGWTGVVLTGAPPGSYGWWAAIVLAAVGLANIVVPLAIFIRNRLEARQAEA